MAYETSNPIKIDLRTALTDEVVAEALPHLGECKYAAPCIIGAMIPADLRAKLDDDDADALTSVVHYLSIGAIEFASKEQANLACDLQDAFDNHSPAYFQRELDRVRAALGEQVA